MSAFGVPLKRYIKYEVITSTETSQSFKAPEVTTIFLLAKKHHKNILTEQHLILHLNLGTLEQGRR